MINIAWASSPETIKNPVNLSAWHAIMSASPVVQLTLITLVLMSVISWAIIFSKKKQLKSIREANEPFLDDFWKANALDDIYGQLDDHPDSPLAHVFRSGYWELRKIADSGLAGEADNDDTPPLLTGIDNLERALNKAVDTEISHIESRLSFLATTGSSGPFIGLFGTVWGIMNAFQKIAATNSANLAVVAPGISEALIATAIGLAAAIPASVSYNHFITQLKKEELELNNFASDFLNIAKRNFFKE